MIIGSNVANNSRDLNHPRPKQSFGISRMTQFILGVLALTSLPPASGANFYCGGPPGVHEAGKSPVYGNRNWEYKKMKDSSFFPLFEKFAKKLYTDENFRAIVREKDDPQKCARLADEAWEQYIARYAPYNCTSENMIEYQPYGGENRVKDLTKDRSVIKISTAPVFDPICEMDRTCPDYRPYFPSLVKIHETRHAEEFPYEEDFGYEMELFPSLKEHIIKDSVLKKCYNEELDAEVDYGKTLEFGGKRFPAGELANFYQKLEKIHGSLAEAVLSTESIAYLMQDPKYKDMLEVIRKYPGSKLAAKKARACLADKNPEAAFIALSAMPDMMRKKQYAAAFKLIEQSFNASHINSFLRLKFFAFVEEFISAGQYELASELIIKGLKVRFFIPDQAISFAQKLIEKEKNWERAVQFAMLGLAHPEDTVQQKGIQIAKLLIQQKQYGLAFTVAIEGLNKKFPERVEANQLALRFIEEGQYELAFQIILKSIEALDVGAISESALQKLIESPYKVKELIEISQGILSRQEAPSEINIMQGFIYKLSSMNELVVSMKSLEEALGDVPRSTDPVEIWDKAVQFAMHALDQQQPEIQNKGLLTAQRLIDCKRYDQALEIAMKGLESSFSSLRSKSSKLAFKLIEHKKSDHAFEMIVKSLERFDFESIPMQGVEYLFKTNYEKTKDLLAFVESMQSRQDLSVEVENKMSQFVAEVQKIQESCKSNLPEW